jgi:hypothetical protein
MDLRMDLKDHPPATTDSALLLERHFPLPNRRQSLRKEAESRADDPHWPSQFMRSHRMIPDSLGMLAGEFTD